MHLFGQRGLMMKVRGKNVVIARGEKRAGIQNFKLHVAQTNVKHSFTYS